MKSKIAQNSLFVLAVAIGLQSKLWAGQFISDIPPESAINLDTDAGREQLRAKLAAGNPSGDPIVLEYSAQYDVSNLQIRIPLAATVGRILNHVPIVGGILNNTLAEADQPRAIKLRALLYPAAQPKGYLLGIHGLQSNARWYAKTGKELAQRGVTSLFYDRRGSGISDAVVDANGNPMLGHVASSQLDHLLEGPLNRAVGNDAEFLEDVQVSYEFLFLVRSMQNSQAPIHLYANCFGARVAYAYASQWQNPREALGSIITTSPGTNMKKGELLTAEDRLALLGPAEKYMEVDLVDEDFTSRPEALAEMGNANLSKTLRAVTNRFMLSVAGLTKKMRSVFKTQHLAVVPSLVIIPARDKIIFTDATHQTFADNYPGPALIAWLDAEHMIEFEEQAQKDLVAIMSQWILNLDQAGPARQSGANIVRNLKTQHEAGQLPSLQLEKTTAHR